MRSKCALAFGWAGSLRVKLVHVNQLEMLLYRIKNVIKLNSLDIIINKKVIKMIGNESFHTHIYFI